MTRPSEPQESKSPASPTGRTVAPSVDADADAASVVRRRLFVLDAAARLLLDRIVAPGTLAIAGDDGGDVVVPALQGSSVFLRLTGAECVLYLHEADGRAGQATLALGRPTELAGLTWILATDDGTAAAPSADDGEAPEDGAALAALFAWMPQPMGRPAELRARLGEFLELAAAHSKAQSGMLVLAEEGGMRLVATHGLAARDAQKLWEKMPETLVADVLRTGARVLLPEELRGAASLDATVYVRGVRSVAGFPVLAEGRLVGVYYLGFANMLASLTPTLTRTLETAAAVLGLVIQRAELRGELETLLLKVASSPTVGLPDGRLMVGASPKLVEVYRLLSRFAPVDVPTLITGETGTGKELAAKELHRLSTRAQAPFVVVNAAAMPETLIESELFGHKKGAFTGALADRIGLIEQARGGTLFIDEIGELALAMQAKLLRALQERSVTRVGDTVARPVDFRLVSATHRALEEMVAAGTFREDLYYRIAGAAVRMPALRERDGDIGLLATHFRRAFAARHGLADKDVAQDAQRALARHPWPGNVRELENVIARAFVMAEGGTIQALDLGLPAAALAPGDIDEVAPLPPSEPDITLDAARDAWMRDFLTRALKRHNGKRSETARALGVGDRTLFRYLDQFGIRDH